MKKHHLILIVFCFISVFGFSQTDVKNEVFKYHLIKNKDGGKVVYIGDDHYIEIELNGELKDNIELNDSIPINNNFISLDKRVIQFTFIPMTYNIINTFNIENLSIIEQKQILENYIIYEFNYQKNVVGVKMNNFNVESSEKNKKLFYFISYEFQNEFDKTDINKKIYKNLFLITITYNSILYINIPLTKSSNGTESEIFLKNFSEKIKLYNKKYKE